MLGVGIELSAGSIQSAVNGQMSVDRTMPAGGSILPGNPPQACPDLLTEDEAVRYLRLDDTAVGDPRRTLRYYRERALLRATQVGRKIRYRRVELERLLDRLTETNPR